MLILYDIWNPRQELLASAGHLRQSGTSGGRAALTFTGTSIAWLTARGPTFGKADVYIDGVKRGRFDLYSAEYKWQLPVVFKDLAANVPHRIEIRPLGLKNAASRGTDVVVDAFKGPITSVIRSPLFPDEP